MPHRSVGPSCVDRARIADVLATLNMSMIGSNAVAAARLNVFRTLKSIRLTSGRRVVPRRLEGDALRHAGQRDGVGAHQTRVVSSGNPVKCCTVPLNGIPYGQLVHDRTV